VRTANLLSLLNTSEKVSLLEAAQPAIPRLLLPAYSMGRECERGDTSGSSGTTFPSGAALAASWNEVLVFEVARLTAVEVKGNANSDPKRSNSASCYGPVLNFIHDPRWGRTNEMLTGEDTTLGAVLGAAFVRGLQSWAVDTAQGPRMAVSSTVKHLNAYSGPEGTGYTFGPLAERFSFEARFSSQGAWREFFLPAFRAASKAGARGFMCSYSAFSTPDGYLNNSPACGSPQLLQETVRDLWKWDGFVLSDAGAVAFIGETLIGGVPFGHHATHNDSETAVRALEAGCDIELTCCGAPQVFPTLEQSVVSGRLQEAVLERALSRAFKNRFELGELDPPGSYPWQTWGAANVSTPEMVALTAAAASQGIVMLKNEGSVLPALPALLAGKKLALIGPLANDPWGMLGGYGNYHPPFIRTFFDGLTAAYPLSEVELCPACDTPACPSYNASAVALAGQPEVALIVVALGTTGFYRPGANNESGACGCAVGNAIEGAWQLCHCPPATTTALTPPAPCPPPPALGECCDRANTELPGAQLALLQALAALGKPLVLLLNTGSTLTVEWARTSPSVHAILHAPFLGMSAGVGLARVLTGQESPSGKTTLTWYRDAARDLPPLADYSDASLYNRTYRYTTAPVTFPFGFGLSYGAFVYSALAVAPAQPRACDALALSVSVENRGAAGAWEVVQAYGTLRNSTALHTPRKQLLAFAKVWVAAGGSAQANLTVLPAARAVLRHPDLVQMVGPGAIELAVAGSSDPEGFPGTSGSGVKGLVTIVGPAVPLEDC
jgi:beta-glucosidase